MSDRIEVNVVNPVELADSGSLAKVESVGVSRLEEHIKRGFDPGVPVTDRAQRVSGALLRTMTNLSTDPEYSILAQLDTDGFVPHWLKLVEPAVATARTASGYVHRELTTRENNEVAAAQPIDPDFMFVYSVLELSGHALAFELGIDHPSDLAKEVAARTDAAGREDPAKEQRKTLELYASLPTIPSRYRRRLKEVRRLGGQVIGSTAEFLPRIVAAVERIPAAPETEK